MNSLSLGILAGAGLGSGLVLLWRGSRPQTPSLRKLIEQTNTPRQQLHANNWREQLGTALIERDLLRSNAADLRITDKDEHSWMARRASLSVLAFLLPTAAGSLLAVLGVGPYLGFSVAASAGIAALVWWIQGQKLTEEATAARKQAVQCTILYIRMTRMQLAQGRHWNNALQVHERLQGPFWARLRKQLANAAARGQNQGEALHDLGQSLNVPLLESFGMTARASIEQGTSAGDILTALAQLANDHQSTELKADRERVLESLALPNALLGITTMVMWMWPLVQQL